MPPPTPYSAVPRLRVDRHGPDRHVERCRRRTGGRRRQEADGPAVDPSRRVLEVRDDPHRPHLGRARDRTAGEERAEHVGQTGLRLDPRGHGRRELPDGLEPFGLEHLGPSDRARRGDPAQVVAEQVDDHRVLGAILHRRRESLADRVVLLEPAAARRRALHRPRREQVAVQPEEELGRRRQDPEPAGVQVRAIARLVARSTDRDRGRARHPARSNATGTCGSPDRCRRPRCARGCARSPGRSCRGPRSGSTRRTAAPHRRAATASTVSWRCWNIANQANGRRANGSSGARARTASDGSIPGAAS